MEIILDLINAGWTGLLDYLAAHVLLCLVPAFFIAGYAAMFEQTATLRPTLWALFGLLIAVLIAGTLQIGLLKNAVFSVTLPVTLSDQLQDTLDALSLTLQGALLILLLVLIAPVAWRGMNNVLVGFNRWTWVALVLVAITLLLAAPTTETGSLVIHFTGRFFAEAILLGALAYVVATRLERDELAHWLWETWRFVRQIFPLLIVGVFLAGMLREITPEEWVKQLAGRNTIWANLIGVTFGVFMYFPTLVEVPVAAAFLDLGMHRGPLLAYLLADPELSLQSILVTGRILGRKKTVTYMSLVAIFSTAAGYLFGLALAAW